MALNIKSVNFCKSIDVTYRPYTSAATGDVKITDVPGGTTITYPINISTSAVTKLRIPIADLASSSGVFMVTVEEAGSTRHMTKAVLVHCDIDCCLTKLTNELLACECDCPRCSSALAKAQKIYLLIQSAIAKVEEINSDPWGSTVMGHYDDAYDKYKKAKELCDGSCGCEC
tara:strand:+ start:3712 stop:4227 length:516 start_codon:yes stop_codon:yes gene_type:complete